MHILLLVLHILGAGLLIGVVFLSLFLSVKPTWTPEKLSHLKFVGQFGMWASIWLFVTGVILAASEWHEFQSNKLFWAKMALYVLEGTLASQLIGKKARLAASGQPSGLSLVLVLQTLLVVGIIALAVVMVEANT